VTTRRYHSAVRAEQSRATRQRVLDAARAQVSVQTVYNTVGGKAAVLKAVYDVMIAGDADPVPMIDRPTGRATRATDDPRECLALYARMGREIYERIGPLVPILLTEGAGDREVRGFIDTIEPSVRPASPATSPTGSACGRGSVSRKPPTCSGP